jgi:6-phosphofructokinase 1
MKRIGLLTGGGDAPGLNAVIRAVVYKATSLGYEVCGFERGWAGLLEKSFRYLSVEDVKDIHREGGTILFSSRTNPAKIEGGFDKVLSNIKDLDLYALIASGGEDTLGVANHLHQMGAHIIGVPKTIDNDVNATDYTFGFDTAINRAMEALDRLHTTARSHQRVIIVEIMGRHAGWMALYGGMAGGAHIVLIPEVSFNVKDVCSLIKKRYENGEKYAIVAVAEGANSPDIQELTKGEKKTDTFGHVLFSKGRGIAENLANIIESETGFETRHVVLGHLQRWGDPSVFDRILGTRLGVKAVELAHEGKFGYMASLCGTNIKSVPLADAVGTLKTVPIELYQEARLFFG